MQAIDPVGMCMYNTFHFQTAEQTGKAHTNANLLKQTSYMIVT